MVPDSEGWRYRPSLQPVVAVTSQSFHRPVGKKQAHPGNLSVTTGGGLIASNYTQEHSCHEP